MRNKIIMVVGITLCLIGITSIAYADSLASRLSGKILLQVEGNGEAWYINPANQQRYFMGRPEDAFALMRKLGLGISNSNLEQIPIAADSPAVPSGETQTTEVKTETKTEATKTWQVTQTFTGTQDVSTEPFTLTDGAWIKVRYTYTPSKFSYFSITLSNSASVLDSDLLHNDTVEVGDVVSNETNIYNKKKRLSILLRG